MDSRPLFIGIDDTDPKMGNPGQKIGTGQVARKIAKVLMDQGMNVLWVTRHQLAKLRSIRYSTNNSSKAITLLIRSKNELNEIIDIVTEYVNNMSYPDSNSGIAINEYVNPPTDLLRLASKTKRFFVKKCEIYEAVNKRNIKLIPLKGDGSGVIGAFASSILASTGNDGRIIDIPKTNIREIRNKFIKVKDLLKLGINVVKSLDNKIIISDEVIYIDKLRPKLENFNLVLYVKRDDDIWRAQVLD